MRKFILIASMVLASATAHAGSDRNLTLASSEAPAAVEQPKAVEAPKATEAPAATETPANVARPAAVDTVTEAPKDLSKSATDKTAQAPRADKPKHRHESTEARVIYELHRHGIYW
jgi:hypothetical protein